ncbi:alpha/beta fold hydrolase [Seminibacterium arietis]|uniref:Alpha/beta fold hydrolase n=1 Tax=Seminibacterium arietis TaxID=1173502 RepID=A0ABW3I602_9PAST
MENNLLNFQFNISIEAEQQKIKNKPVLIFIHGLFGDMNNLRTIAKTFSNNYRTLQLDVRNHGHSFHSKEMNYDLLAHDLINLINYLGLKSVILIGHSMGGKIAMKTASLYPEIVQKIVVIDIAPVKYNHCTHDDVFAGLFAVKQSAVTSRQDAKQILEQYILEESIIQFMLKSFNPQSPERFCFNLSALYDNYGNLMNWQDCFFANPTLFIKGGLSNYILPEYTDTILTQFPQAQSFTINGSGHWVHAEKCSLVTRAIERFLF